jgi:1-acyl-sn-glycerol-3-phosphate acyltransferase
MTPEETPSYGSRRLLDSPIPPEVLAVLSPIERLNFEIALRMNREPMKEFWTWCQEAIGATWIKLVTGNLLRVEGLHHVVEAYQRGAILFVANHRSYFDLFVTSSVLHRQLTGRKRLYFPVIGQFYYQSLAGLALNQLFAFWSMFPPLFALPTHGASDRYALDLLVELCAQGPGQILGIHPEGGRNLNPDPYSFMRFQPGTGKVIHAARPIVIPTFIAGLDNDVLRQVKRNWSGGEPVRIWFDAPMALDDLLALPAKGSTYKLIVDAVMGRVVALGAMDRERYWADGRRETGDGSGDA